MGFSRQEYCSDLPFPSPVDHILSDLSTMTHPSQVALLAWLSFIDLDKAVVHVIRLASCLSLWFQSACPLRPSLSAYHLTWTWGIPSGCSSKMQPLLLTLDVGYQQPLLTLDVEYLFSAAHGSSAALPPLATYLRIFNFCLSNYQ